MPEEPFSLLPMLIGLAGGLALFLHGMTRMSNAMRAMAASRLSSSPWRGAACLLALGFCLGTRLPAAPGAGDGGDGAGHPTVRLADGAKVELRLFADGDQVENVSAISMADDGRVFAVETHRRNGGVSDNRENPWWLVDDAASFSVRDRLAMYAKHSDRHPPDFFTGISEKIRWVEDRDQNGRSDHSGYFDDTSFGQAADGIASGILAWDEDLWFACLPKIWKFSDRNRDGKPDTREVVHDGFGLHVSFFGHDLNGFTPGPDGRLYFTIADRGANVLNHEGRQILLHGQGAVLRMEMDGSQLEVVHTGLRNPKELAFDDLGNLFTVDNNADAGDRARVTQILEGADSGWRMGHQMLISFSKELGHATRPPIRWMDEKMWEPAQPAQPWWLFPPMANFTSGPSGLTREPGGSRLAAALPPGAFLICDYRGSAQSSGLRWFTLRADATGFQLDATGDLLGDIACTDADFGPDGRLYVSDYIGGWGVPDDGRIWTVAGDESTPSRETTGLLSGGMRDRSVSDLMPLLGHVDQRVRLRAQFNLAARAEAESALIAAARDIDCPLPGRLHAVWGIGQRARLHGSTRGVQLLRELSGDAHPQIRGWSAVMLAECGDRASAPAIASLLADPDPLVVHRAAQAMARLGPSDAPATIAAITTWFQRDLHDPRSLLDGVRLLTEVAGPDTRAAVAAMSTVSARKASVVAARRLRDPGIISWLSHPDQTTAMEALSAIHDEDIPCPNAASALLQLAEFGGPWTNVSPLSKRRLLNLNFRAGRTEDAARLWQAATTAALDKALRLEALHHLEHWDNPHALDRVTGEYRPLPAREASAIDGIVQAGAPALAGDPDPEIQAAALRLALAHHAELPPEKLQALARDAAKGAEPRVQAIRQIAATAPPGTRAFLHDLTRDGDPRVAAAALIHLGDLDAPRAITETRRLIGDATAPLSLRQEAVRWLGSAAHPDATRLLKEALLAAAAGTQDPSLRADAHHAATRLPADDMDQEMSAALAQSENGFLWAKDGGAPAAGHALFFTHGGAQCSRCHALGGTGGNAGPALDGIGARRDRGQLLESMIHPGAKLSPGFGTATVVHRDGRTLTGVLKEETPDHIAIETPEAAVTLARSDITDLRYWPSAMPDMTTILRPRQVRDLVAFLAGLQTGSSPKAADVPAPPPGELDQREEAEARPTSVATAGADAPGKSVYENLCAACHGPDGSGVPGVYPPLNGSEWLNHDLSALIRMMLHGLEGPITVKGVAYNSLMPPNGETLGDQEIADVINFARAQWGTTGLPVADAAMVAAERTATETRSKPWTVAELGPPPNAPGATSPGPSSVAASPTVLRPVRSQPWLTLILLSLPVLAFLYGILRLRGK